ncbi:hypothetical protein [Halorubrum sp. F4]|uniref:hypothetical protein n=1 Tax=Halorubrum sp. F4 TaxID=2989715 RepID=UPI00248125AF|nr:hypothetical protein [Halorubrum sp. F4]
MTAGTTVVGGPVALGWMLRETEIIGSDPVPEGMTAEALENQIHQGSMTLKSRTESTLVDNQTIIDGLSHTLYTEAKKAAIDEFNTYSESEKNDQSTKDAVLAAAQDVVVSHGTTVANNFLKSWNEMISQLKSYRDAAVDHPDLSDPITLYNSLGDTDDGQALMPDDSSVTLPDGTTVNMASMGRPSEGDNLVDSVYKPMARVETSFGTVEDFGHTLDWWERWDQLTTTVSDVESSISTWVDSVFEQVAIGQLDLDELITPSQQASMLAEEESESQAIADLAALNIPVDVERQATISISSTGATVRGMLGLTDDTDSPIETGTTYDPSTFSGSVFVTMDVSLLEGDWTGYDDATTAGNTTLTAEPYDGTALQVETEAGETFTANASDWQSGPNGTWYYDASGSLDDPSSGVASIDYFANSTTANYQTIQIDSEFTVESFENTETGESADSASFESTEPQSDSNYITQDEWDSLEQQNQELIDKYEASQNNGGGLDLSALDMFGFPGEVVAVVIAGTVGFLTLSN